jgi:hypothetical protein
MPYGKKYTLSAISKSGLTYTAEIWENGYAGGTVYTIPAGSNPFVLDCLASSDDPFQPILPTTLTIQADFTDFTGPLPDFITTDDKKYYVKLYANGTTYFVWQGFILMDTLTIPFTTGRNYINIICVDGLGILKSSPYAYTSAEINIAESITSIINNCLKAIGTPELFYINTAVNYYSDVQNTSLSHFSNTFIRPSVWMNNDFTMKSCYDVLETICISYGAQIFQSNGEWWVTSVNERASDTIRVFRTDSVLSADTLSTININRTIKPYQSDVNTPFYFINNSQSKTISKGFQSLQLTGDCDYPDNMVMNGNMVTSTSGVPDFFTRVIGSGGSFVLNSNTGISGATMISGTGSTDLTANSCGEVSTGDILEIGYQVKVPVIGKLQIEITVTFGIPYYYKKTATGTEWSTIAGFYEDDIDSTNMEVRTITTLPAPQQGNLGLKFRVEVGVLSEAFIANIKSTAKPTLTEKRILYNQTSGNQYKKEINVKLGIPFPVLSYSQSQALSTSAFGVSPAINFQRFGGSEVYSTLGNLLFSQLYNILYVPQVNMSLNAYNLFNQSGGYIIGILHNFGVEDTTGLVNVNSARFVLGACSIDFINNELNGTALQVSNAILTYTLVDNPTATPTPICKQYTNNTAANWVGAYVRCDGIAFGPVTLLPGQSVCARIYTPVLISGLSNLTMGINCV